jgi:hypothetical protein
MSKPERPFELSGDENAFFISLLRDQAAAKANLTMAKARGICERHMAPSYLAPWKFLSDFVRDYGDLPSLSLVMEKTGLQLGPEPDGPFSYCMDALIRKRMSRIMRDANAKEALALAQNDLDLARAAMREREILLRQEELAGARAERFGEGGAEVLSYYERIESGKFGIPVPFPSLQEATMGLWPGDVGLVIARPATGKTFSAILFAICAWKAGYKVLFVTTEMSKLSIRLRFYAMLEKINYNRLRKARLTAQQRAHLFAFWNGEFASDDRFQLIGGQFDAQVETLDAHMDSFRPDLVVIDGAYLLRIAGNGKLTPVENDKLVMNEIKRIGGRYNAATVATTQYNRNAAAGKKGAHDTANISGTDAAGWNATWAFGMARTPEQKLDNVMGWHELKMREGICGDFITTWNFDTMTFEEIPRASVEAAAAPDYGTGFSEPAAVGAGPPPSDVFPGAAAEGEPGAGGEAGF